MFCMTLKSLDLILPRTRTWMVSQIFALFVGSNLLPRKKATKVTFFWTWSKPEFENLIMINLAGFLACNVLEKIRQSYYQQLHSLNYVCLEVLRKPFYVLLCNVSNQSLQYLNLLFIKEFALNAFDL